MEEKERKYEAETTAPETEAAGHKTTQACDDITDPVRRGLCKLCGMPVLGAAPFCQEHEPPVP